MDYHYQSIDPAMGDRIDEDIRNLLNSSTHNEDRRDIREDLADKCAERVVEDYHRAIMDALEVSIFPSEE